MGASTHYYVPLIFTGRPRVKPRHQTSGYGTTPEASVIQNNPFVDIALRNLKSSYGTTPPSSDWFKQDSNVITVSVVTNRTPIHDRVLSGRDLYLLFPLNFEHVERDT